MNAALWMGLVPVHLALSESSEGLNLMTTFCSEAIVKADNLATILPALLEHMKEHATVNYTVNGATIVSPFGSVEIIRHLEELRLEVKSFTPEVLSLVKMFIAEHVFEFAGDTASIVWSDEAELEQAPDHFQELIVTDVFDITPLMRRVTFSCERISAFLSEAGYHVRLLLAPSDTNPVWPTQTADGRLKWPSGENTLISRVYTISNVDVLNSRVAIDFVLHTHAGPASLWALQACKGKKVGILGPSGGKPGITDSYFMFGDETAIPAISRLLSELPADARGMVCIEVQNAEEVQQISHPARIEVRWLFRETAAAGTTTLLQDAFMALPKPALNEAYYVWVSCELSSCSVIRAHLRDNWKAHKSDYLVTTYWRRGKTGIEVRDEH